MTYLVQYLPEGSTTGEWITMFICRSRSEADGWNIGLRVMTRSVERQMMDYIPEESCIRCDTATGEHTCWRREVQLGFRSGVTLPTLQKLEPLRRHEKHPETHQFAFGKNSGRS